MIGYNKDFQNNSNIGKRNNQNFVNIPYGKLIDILTYLGILNSINIIIQEESYTSKASFLDKDEIPIYKKGNQIKTEFSGKRIKRGLYKTKKNILVNADVNGSCNILKKYLEKENKIINQIRKIETPKRLKIV